MYVLESWETLKADPSPYVHVMKLARLVLTSWHFELPIGRRSHKTRIDICDVAHRCHIFSFVLMTFRTGCLKETQMI